MRRLESEISGLRRAMRTRGLIEQAKGVLAERLGIDPEESFEYLSRLSQDANVRVVDVAAEVLGMPRVPAETDAAPDAGRGAGAAGTEAPGDVAAGGNRPGPAPTPGPPPDLPAAWGRRLRRVTAAVEAASAAEIAEAVATEGVEKATAVGVFAVEPDGGLRIVSASGWPPRLVADWRHVPSAVPTPASRAVRLGSPLWIDGTQEHDLLLIGPGPRRAALPFGLDGEMTGVLELVWPHAKPFDEAARRYLSAVAATVGRHLGRLIDQPGPSDGRWLEAALDGVVTPAQLLAPVRDGDGAIIDFMLLYANQAALASSGLSPVRIGRRLLDAEPGLLAAGVFDAYVKAYEHGAPVNDEPNEEVLGGRPALVRRQAARLGVRLLATWQVIGADTRAARHLERMEVLGGFGWADWNLLSGDVYWSPGLFRLLGRDPARGPVPPKRLAALVVDEDRAAAEAGADRVLHALTEASGEVRLHLDGGVRHVTVVAEPMLDHRGRPIAVLALAQDVTEARRRETQLRSTGEQLAAQRIRLATEQTHTEELRRLLFPSPEQTVEAGRLRVLARHVAPRSIHRFRGDFYDVTPTEDGVVVTLGDVFGSGAAAATAVARLRHAARVLCLSGLAPAPVLALLNDEFAQDAEPPMASLVVARFDQGSLDWAQAGHYAPILLRDGRGRSLARPPGVALGLTPTARYEDGRLALRAGDTVVFYTDGLIGPLNADSDPVPALVRGFGQAWRLGGPAAVLDGFLRPAEDEACVVAVEFREA